ncbi:MAG: hypothetical protein Fues2KO_16840 [Fuerstiella sp.]
MTDITISNTSDHQSQELALLDQAHAALMEACTVDEVRDVRDRAEAVRSYAKKARLGREMVVEASALRLRSERRLGQLLQQLPLAKASPGNQYTSADDQDSPESQIRLQDVGITKSDSSRLQRIAAVPEERFQTYVKECLDAGRECSTAACLRLLGPKQATKKKTTANCRLSPALQAVLQTASRFSTLLANPFAAEHGFGTAVNVDDLCRQPVEKLATPSSHLYFLTPDHRLPQALRLVEAWGFTYAFCLPWRAESNPESGGVDAPWSQQLLLVGSRGTPELAALSSSEYHRLTSEGFNHEALVELIQHLSPGPYLDLTSNAAPINGEWTTISGGRVG